MVHAHSPPILRAEDIEDKAQNLLRKHAPEVLLQPQFTPLAAVCAELHAAEGLLLVTCALGKTKMGNKILGAFRPHPPSILIDEDLAGDGLRFNFVLGHELGHYVLHGRVRVNWGEYQDSEDQIEHDLSTWKKKLKTDRDWLEWQANRFSSAILMPRSPFQAALCTTQKAMGITRGLGRVFVEFTKSSLKDFNATLANLATIYNVNKTNVECRLRDLGLLDDQRDKGMSHISQLLPGT